MNDLISRQAAIRFIRDKVSLSLFMKRSVDKADKACMELCEMLDRELPSAQPKKCEDCRNFNKARLLIPQPERKWTPVSEGLPEDGVEVWVTIKGSDVIKVESGETIEQAIDRVNRIRWVTRAYWSEEEHGWNDPTFGCPLVVQPITWMPIEKPEPYEEEQK